MNIFKLYSLREKLRLLITLVICLVFCIQTVTIAINSENYSAKVMFLVIMVIFVFITMWAEYLKFMYQLSTYFLNIKLDPTTAMEIFIKLKKRDLFKNYMKTFLIFKILYNMTIENYKECITIIQSNDRFFRSSLDNLLIKKYTHFFCNYKLQNKDNVNRYYIELRNMKDSKLKHSVLSPLYNWEFIDAIYFKANNELIKSKMAFEHTNTVNMNNRELLQYFSEYYDLLSRLNLSKESSKIKDRLKKLRGGNCIENK